MLLAGYQSLFCYIINTYIYIYRLVPPLGTTYDIIRWGGGMGWDVNVHVNLQKQLMLRTRGVGWGGMGWDVNVHVNLQMMMMMMMMMTMMMMML